MWLKNKAYVITKFLAVIAIMAVLTPYTQADCADEPENLSTGDKIKRGVVETLDKTFVSRLFSTDRNENGICEDGEWPFRDKDCTITGNTLLCRQEECVLNHMWFAKLLLVAGLVFTLRSKGNDKLLIFFGLVILLSIIYTPNLKDTALTTLPEITVPTRMNTEGRGDVMDYAPALFIAGMAALIFMYVRGRK